MTSPDHSPEQIPGEPRALDDRPLLEADAGSDPFALFGRWMADAAGVMKMPEAMSLATMDGGGRPSSRMVLCKGWDQRGFVFFTNAESRKGTEMEAHPVAALLFYWEPLGRQVRVEGAVAPLTARESDDYFTTRPRGAQIGARASAQSQPVPDRDTLDRQVASVAAEFEGRDIPRPVHWGGYRVAPEVLEFWQNRRDRLHDRLRFTPAADIGSSGGEAGEVGWLVERLQP